MYMYSTFSVKHLCIIGNQNESVLNFRLILSSDSDCHRTPIRMSTGNHESSNQSAGSYARARAAAAESECIRTCQI